jgi:hypothetical protein
VSLFNTMSYGCRTLAACVLELDRSDEPEQATADTRAATAATTAQYLIRASSCDRIRKQKSAMPLIPDSCFLIPEYHESRH